MNFREARDLTKRPAPGINEGPAHLLKECSILIFVLRAFCFSRAPFLPGSAVLHSSTLPIPALFYFLLLFQQRYIGGAAGFFIFSSLARPLSCPRVPVF